MKIDNIVACGFAVFLVLFIWAVLMGAEINSEQEDRCRAAGGIPQTERGVYKACMKPDNFINVG